MFVRKILERVAGRASLLDMPQPIAGVPARKAKDLRLQRSFTASESRLTHCHTSLTFSQDNQSCSHIRIERQIDGRCLTMPAQSAPFDSRTWPNTDSAQHQNKLRTAVGDGPLENVYTTIILCVHADKASPGAAVGPQPLQHLQMAAPSSVFARPLIPRTAVSSCPLQNAKVSSFSGLCKCTLIPGTAVSSRPLQHTQVASLCSEGACRLIPRTTVFSRPLQHKQVSAKSRSRARLLVPRTALLSRPL